jgi:hypothetical protein
LRALVLIAVAPLIWAFLFTSVDARDSGRLAPLFLCSAL